MIRLGMTGLVAADGHAAVIALTPSSIFTALPT